MKYLSYRERRRLLARLAEINRAPLCQMEETAREFEIKEVFEFDVWPYILDEYLYWMQGIKADYGSTFNLVQDWGTPVYMVAGSTDEDGIAPLIPLVLEQGAPRRILEAGALKFPKVRACGVEALDWLGRFEEALLPQAEKIEERIARIGERWVGNFQFILYSLTILKFYDLVFRAAAASEDRGVEICVGQLEGPALSYLDRSIYLYAVLDPDRLFEPDYMDEVRRRYEALAYAANPYDVFLVVNKPGFGDPYISQEEYKAIIHPSAVEEITETLEAEFYESKEYEQSKSVRLSLKNIIKYIKASIPELTEGAEGIGYIDTITLHAGLSAIFSHLTIVRGIERYRL